MALSASELKCRHLEFTDATDAFVEEKIAKAYRENNEAVFGDSYDDAVEWYACHLIASSPHGVQALLVPDGATSTIYYDQWRKLARPYGAAHRL